MGFSVEFGMSIFSFEWTVPTLIMDYYSYLILHYFPLGWECLTSLDWLIAPC